MRQRHVCHPEVLILPAEVRCFGIDEVQGIAETGVAVFKRCVDEALSLDGGDDVERFCAAQHGGTGEQPRQAEGVVTVDMGDEYRPQLHHGVVSA